MFKHEEKRLTDEQATVLHAIYSLVFDGDIPFTALEPVYKDFAKRIEDCIKEEEKLEKQYQLDIRKKAVEYCNKFVDSTKEKLNKYNSALAEMRAELEDQKSKKGFKRDNNRIRNLLWWISNNEEEVEKLENVLKQDEASLKEAEENLNKFLDSK